MVTTSPDGEGPVRELPGYTFARRLKQERENAGISQIELARRISNKIGNEINPTAITRIEKQDRSTRLDEAVFAAEALDLPLSAFLSDDIDRQLSTAVQEHLGELAQAEQQLQETCTRIQHLVSSIQSLTADREQFHKHLRG